MATLIVRMQNCSSKSEVRGINPIPNNWSVWQVAICRIFLSPDVTHLRLCHPTGFWLQHCDPFWMWWKHPVQNILYCQAADQSWSKRRFHTQRGNRLIFGGPVPVPSNQVPPGLLCASVTTATGSPFILLHSTAITHEAPIPKPATLQAALHLLPSSSKWAIQIVRITDNGQTIAAAIQQGTAVAVSDGSLKLSSIMVVACLSQLQWTLLR
jgi:hypothetical protein